MVLADRSESASLTLAHHRYETGGLPRRLIHRFTTSHSAGRHDPRCVPDRVLGRLDIVIAGGALGIGGVTCPWSMDAAIRRPETYLASGSDCSTRIILVLLSFRGRCGWLGLTSHEPLAGYLR